MNSESGVQSDDLFNLLDNPPPLPAPKTRNLSPELEALRQRAGALAAGSKADNTRIAYRKAWRHYAAWSESLGFPPLSGDPQLVGLYFAAIAHLAPSTVRQRAAAIQLAHKLAGVPLDLKHHLAASILQGIEREQGRRPKRQAAAVLDDTLGFVLGKLGDDRRATRDRALFLIAFGAALRRSEVAKLDLGDAIPTERGVKLLVRWSKTDQLGEGQEIAIMAALNPALCARRALEAWLAIRGTEPGPLFCRFRRGDRLGTGRLTPHGVNLIIKRRIADSGLTGSYYSGHSLRAGLATSAARKGAHLHQIMKQTRHRSADAARRYLRDAELWADNVTALLFAQETEAKPPG
jgi:integrase